MKRIQIRFISLISEKFFSAKRAHPNQGTPTTGMQEHVETTVREGMLTNVVTSPKKGHQQQQ